MENDVVCVSKQNHLGRRANATGHTSVFLDRSTDPTNDQVSTERMLTSGLMCLTGVLLISTCGTECGRWAGPTGRS